MSDDLIKKEEAKEAVCKGCLKDWRICHHHWDCPMLTNLEMLPSADRPQGDYNRGYRDAVQGIADEMVKQGKHIEADRPQGEWIEHKERTIVRNGNFIDYFPTEYECSNCGLRRVTYFINSPTSNYCPNCGARMKGVSTDVDCFDTCKHAYSEVCDECYKGSKYNAVKGADDEMR